MFKQATLMTGIFCFALFARAQPVRYKDFVFTGVTKTKDLSYSPDDKREEKKAHLFDLYQPSGDKSTGRPLIIWMHGGGFKFGSKEAAGIQLWSETFAQRGYVCAAINYTLSKKFPIFHFDELTRSCYNAMLDTKTAVAYFKQHYKDYNIDPDKIVLAGNSAGGMMALDAAYGTNADVAKIAGITDDHSSDKEHLKIAAVLNFWGGIFDLNWLNNARIPLVNIYGSEDKIVAPTHKDAPLYGGEDLHNKADELGISNKVKVFDGYSHELQKHFNPLFAVSKGTRERWLEAGQFAADFIYQSLYEEGTQQLKHIGKNTVIRSN